MVKELNVLQAQVNKHGKVFTLSHVREMKECTCLETGVRKTMSRRDFRAWVKQLGGTLLPQLKQGEYININNGKVEKLWGID